MSKHALIHKQAELEQFCKEVAESGFITVDTEFIRDKTYFPRLCLVQVAGDKAEGIIDPLAKGLDLAPLFALLQSKKLLKVFHACRQDIEIFYMLTGKIPSPIFDTQVAAAVCGYGESVGYETLVNKIAKKDIDKSSRYTDWSARPLTDKQLSYALSDVTHLRVIYEKLQQQIDKAGRADWIEEEHAYLSDTNLYDTKPEDAWKRLKYGNMRSRQLAVLRELAAWREKEAREADVPRGHIVKDDGLIELAHTAPTKEADIKGLRRLGKSLPKARLDAILKHVKKALDQPPESYPKAEKHTRLPPDIAGPMELLKMLLKVQSDAEGVSASIIATKDDLESIAMGHKDSPALSGWRYDIFGQKAEALMAGKLSLSLDSKTKQVVFGET